MTHYYCSTFSNDYAYRGLLLYNSLLRVNQDFHLFMFCLHDEVKGLYEQMNLKNATIISLSDVEKEDNQLAAVKKTRNDKEYCWTSKASIMLFVFKHFPYADHIVWLDGDTFFFSDASPIFEEWGQYSIMLTRERWRKTEKHMIKKYGRYNTGFMGFKRDEHALQCLNWFRSMLIKWCYDKHENGLWSDQLYVNDWLERFDNVGVIKNTGINVTPYIIAGTEIAWDEDYVFINGERLIFFHYYGFRYYDGNEFDLCIRKISFSDHVVRWIYMPYMLACNEIMEQLRTIDKNFYRPAKPKTQLISNYFNLAANKGEAASLPNICTLLSKDYLIQGLTLYYSLKRHTPRFQLWVLCVDDTTYDLLDKMNLANVTLVSLKNVRNKKLAKIEQQRKIHEYCWTLKAPFIDYLFSNNYNLDSILYMDADLFFFKDATNIYREWGDNSLFLTKLWLGRKWSKKVGRFSAGLIGFKRDKTGLKCLHSWQRKCLRWCYDKQAHGLWADQKYLDEWPQRYPQVKISTNKGINAGPWNIKRRYKVRREGDSIYFDNMELICYHFSGFEIINEKEYELCNRKKLPAKAEYIYSVYVGEIQKVTAQVQALDNSFIRVSEDRCAELFNFFTLNKKEENYD
jgi:hypothetical protein